MDTRITPWDPTPYPPVPAWVDTVSRVKAILLRMDQSITKDMIALLAAYNQQAFISQIPGIGGNPAVAAALGVAVNKVRALTLVEGELKIYRIQLDAWVANQPYYDDHPDEPHPFPVMPQEMLDYLKALEAV